MPIRLCESSNLSIEKLLKLCQIFCISNCCRENSIVSRLLFSHYLRITGNKIRFFLLFVFVVAKNQTAKPIPAHKQTVGLWMNRSPIHTTPKNLITKKIMLLVIGFRLKK
nr:MAG TPA: hypothetical protein [Caudoviricetes sp.]